MKIIGISGHKGSGKTTVAEWLRATAIKSVHMIGFSYAIKDAYCYLFEPRLSPSDFDSQKTKDIEHVNGKTHRELLQEFGTGMRGIWPDIWINHWKKCWIGEDGILLVPDVRFPNEVESIHRNGGPLPRG
jgi:hypothetical protein